MNRARRSPRAGFTLIELMVALTIAAFVIATAYTMGGASARHFQEQQRVGHLQLSTRLAIERIRRDVERAGLHGTPFSDHPNERLCGTPPSPAVTAVQITDAGSTTFDPGANSTVERDLLTLTGNFITSDAYLIRSASADGSQIYLQDSWQGFRRSFGLYDPLSGGSAASVTIDDDRFSEVFAPGRLLHVSTLDDRHMYVAVQGTGSDPGGYFISVNPPLPPGECLTGLGGGALVAPLATIEYSLGPAPADLAPRDPEVTGPNTVLFRSEPANPNATPRPVLEWAIHFDVDAIIDSAAAGAPALQRVDDGALSGVEWYDVRALIIEVGARSPEQDRHFPWADPIAGAPISRYRVFDDRSGAARVRTATLEITLPNLVQRGFR